MYRVFLVVALLAVTMPYSAVSAVVDFSAPPSSFEDVKAAYLTAVEEERLAAVMHRSRREDINDKSTVRSPEAAAQLQKDLQEAAAQHSSATERKESTLGQLNLLRQRLGPGSHAYLDEQLNVWIGKPSGIVARAENMRAQLSERHGTAGLIAGIFNLAFLAMTIIVLYPILVIFAGQEALGLFFAYMPAEDLSLLAIGPLWPWLGIPLLTVGVWWYAVARPFARLVMEF